MTDLDRLARRLDAAARFGWALVPFAAGAASLAIVLAVARALGA